MFPALAFAFLRVGVFRLAKSNADGNAGQIEGFAQSVYQIAYIGLRQGAGARAEEHEARRARLRLSHITQLDASAGDRRRRILLGRRLQEAIEPGCRNAPVPDFMTRFDGVEELVEPLPVHSR